MSTKQWSCPIGAWVLCTAMLPGCASSTRPQERTVGPQAYIYYKADWVLGETFCLRIVDWGERTIHIAITNSSGARKIGALSRGQFQALAADLRDLGVLTLGSFDELYPYTDPDYHFVDVYIEGKHNKFMAKAPFDAAEIFPDATWHGSKAHAALVERLRRTESDYALHWEVDTYAFEPGHGVADTGTDGVEDVYFTSDGDLQYATSEYRRPGNSPYRTEEWVIWHSLDRKRPPTALRAPEVHASADLVERMLPRPGSVSPTTPLLPTIPGAKLHRLAQPRVFCDGRIGLCARSDRGWAIVAYLIAEPSATEPLFNPNSEDVNPLKIDVAPDGSRVAWVANKRLMVSDHIKIDCASLVSDLEWWQAPRSMYPGE